MTDICERLVRFKDKVCISSDLEVEAADIIEALRAENARLTKERDNALHRAAEYRDKCNQLWNDNNLLRAGRKAMGETE